MNLSTWAICKMNMFLHGIFTADIRKGDTIRDPQHTKGGELMTFDRVIANPPFSLDKWGRDDVQEDSWGRFRFGIQPQSYGDIAFDAGATSGTELTVQASGDDEDEASVEICTLIKRYSWSASS